MENKTIHYIKLVATIEGMTEGVKAYLDVAQEGSKTKLESEVELKLLNKILESIKEIENE